MDWNQLMAIKPLSEADQRWLQEELQRRGIGQPAPEPAPVIDWATFPPTERLTKWRAHQAEQEAQARAAAALVCLACVWHTSSREKALLFRSRDTTCYSTCSRQGDITVRETPGWRRHLGWLVVLLTVLMLGAGYPAAAEPKKFTLINVVLDGTKIWLPSSLMVQQGDEVELTLINKLDDPHGFKIEDFGVKEVVQPKAQMTVTFTASRTGAHSYICHLHPPHLGGNILVLSK